MASAVAMKVLGTVITSSPGPTPQAQQCQPNRFGSATQTNGVVAFAKGGECLLKIRDCRAAGENATIDHFGDRSFKMAPQRSVMGFKI